MAKANITQYSSTPSSNTDINNINIDENCPASGLNNAIRELMAHLKNVDTGSQALTALSVTGALSCGAFTSNGIDDNADANAITIDSSENVGIGTSPNAKLDIKDDSNSTQFILRGRSSDNFGILDFRNNAGDTVKGQVKSDASSNLILRAGSTNDALKIDTNGHITKPLQPAFLVRPTSFITNMAVGSEVTIAMGTEIFDQNSDYNNTTFTFTAPVTGKYRFDYAIRLQDVDTASSYYLSRLNTSNRNYDIIVDTDEYNSDLEYLAFSNSVLADMDAGDTAKLKIYQDQGVAQTDINENNTRFSGNLEC